MPHHITTLEHMDLRRSKDSNGYLVVLSTGEIRLYNDKKLVSTISTAGPISALRYGPFGREEAALAILHSVSICVAKEYCFHSSRMEQ